MKKEISITIENRLLMEKRDMNVYHHAGKSAHMIGCASTVTLPLKPIPEDDYLHVSIVSGPGNLKNKSVVDLPSWLNFDFSSEGKLTVVHGEDRTLLQIPPGLPAWQLTLTRSSKPGRQDSDRVTISDGWLE